jgi:hypothetical protein
MNTDIESAAAHIVRQHRAGFIAGVDFELDSRFIEWGGNDCSAQRAGNREARQPHASAGPCLCVEHPACAPEGATEPVDYATGRKQSADTLFKRVLLVVAVICASIVAYVMPMGPAS